MKTLTRKANLALLLPDSPHLVRFSQFCSTPPSRSQIPLQRSPNLDYNIPTLGTSVNYCSSISNAFGMMRLAGVFEGVRTEGLPVMVVVAVAHRSTEPMRFATSVMKWGEERLTAQVKASPAPFPDSSSPNKQAEGLLSR